RARGAPSPVVHRLVSRAVELVQGQLDQQLDGLDRSRLRQDVKCRHEASVGVLVSTQEPLRRGARCRDGRAEGDLLGRDDRTRLLQNGFMTSVELPRGCQCPGAREEKLPAIAYGSALWEQPQRAAEPARGALGREPCCCLAGLAKGGDSREIALSCRPLDVVR